MACFFTSLKQVRSQRLSCLRRRRAPGGMGMPEFGERSSLVKTRCGLGELVFEAAESDAALAGSFLAGSCAGGCCVDGVLVDCGARARASGGVKRKASKTKDARMPFERTAVRGEFETEIMAGCS